MNKESLSRMIDGTPAERKFLAEQSFGLFCIYYFKNYFKYAFAPYHYDFIQDIEDLDKGLIREIVWIGFRESTKTTFAQLAIIWFLTFEKRKYINVDAYSGANSERSLFDIAYHLLNNKRYISDFGHIYSRERSLNEMKQNKVDNFTTENGCRIEASTTQIDVRGRKHFEYRPDFRWVDDFETHDTRDSAKVTQSIRNNLTSAMGGMEGHACQLYTANYLTEYGNVQWLIDRAKTDTGIRVRNIPVLIDGQPAWPAKYALTDTEAKETGKVSIEDKQRQLGSQVFSYEMMNMPIDDSVAEFKKEWLQTATEDEIKHLNILTFIAIDTAVSKKDSADFTGVTINRVSEQGKRYITAYKLKINPAELIEHLFYLQATYDPEVLGVEETVFLLAIKPFLEEEMRKRNKFITITPLKHGGIKKETRIRGLIPLMESKSVFMVGDCSALTEEMRVFPRGIHDDVLDSFAYSEEIAYKPFAADSFNDFVEEKPLYPGIGI